MSTVTIDLTTLDLQEGLNELCVVAVAEGYDDSEPSSKIYYFVEKQG